MSPYPLSLDLDHDYPSVPAIFREANEARHTPSREELLTLDLTDDDEIIEHPTAMTGNDAFRIIEVIKEREAARRDASA